MFRRRLVGKKVFGRHWQCFIFTRTPQLQLKEFYFGFNYQGNIRSTLLEIIHSFFQFLRFKKRGKKTEEVGMATILPQLLIGSLFTLFFCFLLISFDLICCFILRYTLSILVFTCYIDKIQFIISFQFGLFSLCF